VETSFRDSVGSASENWVAISVEEGANNTGCVVCGSPLAIVLEGLTDTRFGTRGSYQACRCLSCGLEQLFPRPSFKELKKLYEEEYNFGGESETLYTELRERFLFCVLYRLWINIDGDISFHSRTGSGRLLDVGCNEGRGLQIYAANGFQVEGLELNENAAATARRTGFVVHTCLISDLDPAIPFNIAVLSNVLEHSLSPKEMLRDVHRTLARDGQVWVSCPNSRSWLRSIFGRRWINWHVPFHISHFCPETLARLLTDAGFVEIEIRQISPALWATQSLIAYLFARPGEKTKQLRNPFLTLFLMLFARFVLSPLLWLGNRLKRGDCLVATAIKG
jgi:2-polyprenyl-3-methyl-5-hydroxy-6-metoxy-1,4-benzoquinol methylase